MVSRFTLVLALLVAALWSGGRAYFESDSYHFAQVRGVAATYLDRRYHGCLAPETIAVQRVRPGPEFAFTAPFAFSGDCAGTFSGIVRWNGVVYEIDDRVSIR